MIQSFLINRFQILKYKKSFSEPEPVFCGVPQGTILGPILFLVMINDIANDCEDRWKYVDDLTLGEICEANECSKAQILIDNVKTKASSSNMKVNDSKSSILTISFLNSSEPNFLPTISDSLKVRKIKLLGVIITSDLKWEANTSSLVKKGNAGLQMLKLMSKHGAPPVHLGIFTSFIRPILEYAAPV